MQTIGMSRSEAQHFLEALRFNRTSIGGYPLFAIMADGGIMCPKCCRENAKTIVHNTVFSHRARADKWWTLETVDIHWEGEPLQCDECNEDIESAYGPIEHNGPADDLREIADSFADSDDDEE